MNFKTQIKNLTEFQGGLRELSKRQIPYALASALNSTAYGAMVAERKEIADSFDRPTPFVQRGVLYEKASALKLAAFTRIAGERDKFNVNRILAPHVYGGGRGVKASERRLLRTGAMLNGQFMVPGPGAPRDRYGNISGGQMQRILGFARQYAEGGYNVTKQRQDHYVVPGVGVFKRMGKGRSVPVLLFTHKAPQYEQRFEFHYAARVYFDRNFTQHMNQAWNRAMTGAAVRIAER